MGGIMLQCHNKVSLITYSECLHELDIRGTDKRQMGHRKERQGRILEHRHGKVKKLRRRDGEIKRAECSD